MSTAAAAVAEGGSGGGTMGCGIAACGAWELRGSCYPHAGAVRPSAGAAHQRVGEQGPSRARNSEQWKVDEKNR